MKSTLARFTALAAAVAALGMTAVPSSAQTVGGDTTNAMRGHGTDGFGKTDNYDAGRLTNDEYLHGFYCDTTIPAKSATGCEVGTKFMKPPAKSFDPLYITVPLGFSVPPMQMQCPQGLICIDHPPTIDLSAIGGPTNAVTPGHDHFTTTTNMEKPEWWAVYVVGVKNVATYNAIAAHGSYKYIDALIDKHDPNVTAPIPTNLFLYFAVTEPR